MSGTRLKVPAKTLTINASRYAFIKHFLNDYLKNFHMVYEWKRNLLSQANRELWGWWMRLRLVGQDDDQSAEVCNNEYF